MDVELHGIAITLTLDIVKGKLSAHVLKQTILQNEHESLGEVFERGDLVIELQQDRFRCHLPVHAKGFARRDVLSPRTDAVVAQEPLSLGPNGSGRVEGL
ncbi:MAG: hypothetical protein DDT37_02003 [Firmicutes bacterium]|nr:hypothetical protein [candidate division NPL-UPA2 bacterium]